MASTSTTEDFLYELLDNQDNVLRTLPGVLPGGLLEESVHADIRSSASIDLVPIGDVDWLSHRVRISYLRDGVTIPRLTAIPAVKAEEYTATGRQIQLDLYDKTSILKDDTFGQTYAIPAGANLIDTVVAVILSAGETKVSIPPSAASTSTGMVWEPATSKLRVVNDLLTAAGYLTVWCDGLGWFRADPYVRPGDRPRRFAFEGRGSDPYLPGVSRQFDPSSVPNRVRVVGKTDGGVEAGFAEATDERDDNPFSFARRGFWRTHPETDVAAADLAGYAARRLAELQQVYEAHEVTHDWVSCGLNDAGTFRGRLAVLQKRRQRLDVGGLVVSTVRTVV